MKSRGIVIEFDSDVVNTELELQESISAFTITSEFEKYLGSGVYETKKHSIESIKFYPLDAKSILIKLKSIDRLRNPKDAVRVQYDKLKGRLKGLDTAIDSFDMSFIPVDLIKVPNIGEEEKISVNLITTIEFIKVNYGKNGYKSEKIVTGIGNIAVSLIDVSVVNP